MPSHLRCFRGCAGEHPFVAPIYRCPACGGLLDVCHDEAPLRARDAAAWKALFRYRKGAPTSRTNGYPDDSGVWRFREWVAPDVPASAVVSLGEGNSPLVRASRLGESLGLQELWIKQCGTSHTGSFKDLGMTVLVSSVVSAAQQGTSYAAVGCASTGDTSASLAAYGAAVGLPVVVLLPAGKISTAQLVQPLASGAKVVSLETDFDGCMAIAEALAHRGLLYLANSMNALRLEGQKTVAFEITESLSWSPPRWVVLPSGNLGNAYALYLGFKRMRDLGLTDEMPRLCVAQAEAANPLYEAWRRGADHVTPMKASPTLASAIQIGNPVSAERAMLALREMNGVVEQASEEEIADAAARADRAGLYVCPHTAVALAALEKLRSKGDIDRHEPVVVVSTASGLKFTETKVRYHEGALPGIRSDRKNEAVRLPADTERVADWLRSQRG